MTSADLVEAGCPAGGLLVNGANERTVASFRESGALLYAEIGVFDFEDKVTAATARIEAAGYRNVVAHPNSRKIMDSYNWSLMTLLRERTEPRFDYVFIDGSHTWAVDALALTLVDRLLRPGGHVEFDDYHWTSERSPSMNPQAFPASDRLFTREQMAEKQVALVVDLLVRRDRRYQEIVENRLFRKVHG